MSLKGHPNIPAPLVSMGRQVVSFLQGLIDYEHQLIHTGMSIKWGSTSLPDGGFLFKTGQTVNKSDYPKLWAYAQNDALYTTTATTVTIPSDSGFVVKT